MLKAILPNSLAVAHSERAQCQQEVVELIGVAFAEAETKLAERVADTEAKMKVAEGEQQTLLEARSEAEATLQAKAAVVSERRQALDEKAEALRQDESTVREAEAARRRGDAELEAAAAKKERVGATHREVFTPIKDGSAEGESAPEHVDRLLSAGRELALDESLLVSLSSALKKPTSARGSFDSMVLEQFDAEVTQRLAALGATLEQGEPAKAERAQAVQDAEARRADAEAERAACEAALADAKAAEAECQASLTAADTAAGKQQSALSAEVTMAEGERFTLAHFRESSLAAFKELEAPAPAPAEEAGSGGGAAEGGCAAGAEPAPVEAAA